MHVSKEILKSSSLNGCFDRILAIGPHPDDIELGCFGAISEFKKKGSKVCFLVLTNGGFGGSITDRKNEANKSAKLLGAEIHFGNLKDTKVPDGRPTIDVIEKIIKKFKPTCVIMNSPNDTHQDHRNAAKAGISASRFVPVVLFYQTPSSTRVFTPSFYVDITGSIEDKISAVKLHKSQGDNVYMADEAVKGLAQFMALQIYQGGKYYEAFETSQIII